MGGHSYSGEPTAILEGGRGPVFIFLAGVKHNQAHCNIIGTTRPIAVPGIWAPYVQYVLGLGPLQFKTRNKLELKLD